MSEAVPQQPDLAARLRHVRVGVRADLDTTRHVFRGRPSYILRDPLTFQSHRLDPADYEILVSLDASRSLGEIFADLVQRGKLTRAEEQRYFEFVFLLHRLGFLRLPLSDDKLLYRRYRARQQARRRAKLLSLLFLQIPLWNPDAFLERTIRYARPLYSRTAFGLWAVMTVAAVLVAAGRWHDLQQPLNGLLAARNLPLIWLTLIVLKVLHEFGHAYACKYFGVHVPEMGVYLIAFTPCAYVDATGSWGLTRRSQRIVIGLAGMYVESAIAALALFVWSATSSPLLSALAYNVIFLAGVTTVLFNINPLMRFDGYYVLSDLLEIPNLRARANRVVLDAAKRHLLGVNLPPPPMTRGLRGTLFVFGVCAAVYRTLVILGIAALVASKLFLVGLMIAVGYVARLAYDLGRRLTMYLWHGEETAPVRARAIAVGVLFLVGVPLAAAIIPVPANVYAAALVGAERETVVRAELPGFLQSVIAERGAPVAPGALLVELDDDAAREALAEAQSRLDAARIRRDAYRVDRPALAQQEQQRVSACEQEVARRTDQLAALRVCAPVAGRVVACRPRTDAGRYVEVGSEIATIVAGRWQVRALLTEEQMSAASPQAGDAAEFRPAGGGRAWPGVVTRVRPAALAAMMPGSVSPAAVPSLPPDLAALTHLGGGDIVVDPDSGQTRQPYFELTITLDECATAGMPAGLVAEAAPVRAAALRHGVTGRVKLRGRAEPLALQLYRRFASFNDRLRQD